MKSERLWYRTPMGRKWHLMAAEAYTEYELDWTMCGTKADWTTGLCEKVIGQPHLCRKCVELSAERPR